MLIEITDKGIGIPEERLAEMNWRLQSTPAIDVSVSRHMGLFAVARLAERHGVQVRLRPASPQGLSVLVWLPDTVIEHTALPFPGRRTPQAGLGGQGGVNTLIRRTPGQHGIGRPAADGQSGNDREDTLGGVVNAGQQRVEWFRPRHNRRDPAQGGGPATRAWATRPPPGCPCACPGRIPCMAQQTADSPKARNNARGLPRYHCHLPQVLAARAHWHVRTGQSLPHLVQICPSWRNRRLDSGFGDSAAIEWRREGAGDVFAGGHLPPGPATAGRCLGGRGARVRGRLRAARHRPGRRRRPAADMRACGHVRREGPGGAVGGLPEGRRHPAAAGHRRSVCLLPTVRDVAVLVLDEPVPAGAEPAPLRFPKGQDLVGRGWWAFGFPDRDPLGDSADGLVGAALAYGWVRLDTGSRYLIRPGFSGGGLWSPDYQAVVGLVGQAHANGDGRAVTLLQAHQHLPEELADAGELVG